MSTNVAEREFCQGEDVVLAQGTYQGTPGKFVGYCTDTNWAEIQERNGSIRNHPVEWLAHGAEAVHTPGPCFTKST